MIVNIYPGLITCFYLSTSYMSAGLRLGIGDMRSLLELFYILIRN